MNIWISNTPTTFARFFVIKLHFGIQSHNSVKNSVSKVVFPVRSFGKNVCISWPTMPRNTKVVPNLLPWKNFGKKTLFPWKHFGKTLFCTVVCLGGQNIIWWHKTCKCCQNVENSYFHEKTQQHVEKLHFQHSDCICTVVVIKLHFGLQGQNCIEDLPEKFATFVYHNRPE